MKKSSKITLISTGALTAVAAISAPIAISLAVSAPRAQDGIFKFEAPYGIYGSKNQDFNPEKSESVQTPTPEESLTAYKFNIERVQNARTEQYKITIVNSVQEKGTITFADGSTSYVATPGETVNLKVQIKPEYQQDYTVLNLRVYDNANPNYSLGVQKIDENNYSFVMPTGGEEGKWFYQSGAISAKITYGLKKIGQWEFDFVSKHYILNITQDNFVFDDVANPELKMQTYPTNGEYLIYRIQLNGHNMKIKNMTVPKNVQMEISNNFNEFPVTTPNSPVLGYVWGGKVEMNGAAGIWNGVRVTGWASSQFGWGINNADSSFDEGIPENMKMDPKQSL